MASIGLEFWVSWTSFQKNYSSWPQQPLTGKVLKFNMIFHDSTKITFVSKHQNKAEFKNLVKSEVLSSNFSGLRNSAALVTSTASTTLVASMTSTVWFHQKNYWSCWFDDSWHQNDQYWSIFVKWTIQNLILAPFLSEAVEDSRCWFFENWFVKLRFPNLLKSLGKVIQQNHWSFYPSELIYFALFTMRHPETTLYFLINEDMVQNLQK